MAEICAITMHHHIIWSVPNIFKAIKQGFGCKMGHILAFVLNNLGTTNIITSSAQTSGRKAT